MSLTLAASSDDRARAIRDHLLPRVRANGLLELQRDTVRLIVWEPPPWLIRHWTPFNEPSLDEAASPGYRQAVKRQRAGADLGYGLEVWRGDRLMSVLWADDGSFLVERFVRGPWEDEALAL